MKNKDKFFTNVDKLEETGNRAIAEMEEYIYEIHRERMASYMSFLIGFILGLLI